MIHRPLGSHFGKEKLTAETDTLNPTRCAEQETPFPGDILEGKVECQKHEKKDVRRCQEQRLPVRPNRRPRVD